MARIRSIHPDACKSRKLSCCSAEAERAYWRLQVHCDDAGRVEDDPEMLASLLFLVRRDITRTDMDVWLDELAAEGLIVRYEMDGVAALEVTQFLTYQKPRHPSPSKLPPPPEEPITAKRRTHAADDGKPPAGVVGDGEGAGARRRPVEERNGVIADAAAIVAERRGKRLESESKNNPSAWLASALSGIRTELAEWGAHAALTANTEWGAAELADAFAPPPTTLDVIIIDGVPHRFLSGTGWIPLEQTHTGAANMPGNVTALQAAREAMNRRGERETG